MREPEKHFVQTQPKPVRLSDYVPGIFASITTKKGMKKAIEKGLVKVNGQVAFTGRYISGGEVIELYAPEDDFSKPIIDLDIEVNFEDEYLAVVYKPAGIVVSGNKSHTLENALPLSLEPSEQADALPRPLPAHRLDYPTSGLVLIGKTASSITALNKLFEKRSIKKTYHAIVQGPLQPSTQTNGLIESNLKGKKAVTRYEIMDTLPSPKFGAIHLIALYPETGRRHQLRVHMAEMGHPILGDQQYGKAGEVMLGKGLFLHATALSFTHPVTEKEVIIETTLPNKFQRILGNKISQEEE